MSTERSAAVTGERRFTSWTANAYGYTVTCQTDSGEEVATYSAGNNPRSSSPADSLAADDPRAESLEDLRRYAQETAEEMAQEENCADAVFEGEADDEDPDGDMSS